MEKFELHTQILRGDPFQIGYFVKVLHTQNLGGPEAAVFSGQAEFKRSAIVVSNLIVFKLDCRTTVDSNVEFNLVMPDSAD